MFKKLDDFRISVEDYISMQKGCFPDSTFDMFRAKDNQDYLLFCKHYFADKSVSDVKELIYVEARKICENYLASSASGKLNGILNHLSSKAKLSTISVSDKSKSCIGLGSHMLQMFEQCAINNNMNEIYGLFCPYNDIASDEQVAEFYRKNGFSFHLVEDFFHMGTPMESVIFPKYSEFGGLEAGDTIITKPIGHSPVITQEGDLELK